LNTDVVDEHWEHRGMEGEGTQASPCLSLLPLAWDLNTQHLNDNNLVMYICKYLKKGRSVKTAREP
jgi:hypothetical protein